MGSESSPTGPRAEPPNPILAVFEVFFDGECPLCVREIRFLRRRDRRGVLRFTDISSPDFDAPAHGLAHGDFMAKIRGKMPDGTLVEGVEVFRQLYAAVGFGWAVSASRLPTVATFLDWGYRWFARNRLRLTGRRANEGCERGLCGTAAGGRC